MALSASAARGWTLATGALLAAAAVAGITYLVGHAPLALTLCVGFVGLAAVTFGARMVLSSRN